MALIRAGDIAGPRQRKAGGDGTVKRDEVGRPKLLAECWLCDGEGRRPSPSGNGRTVKCQGCDGQGIREKSYTRVTTFIDVLEDKSFVQAWQERMVLLGIAQDPTFLRGVEYIDPESREGRNDLNRRAQAAKDLGGANRKSDQGTHLHDLSERVDRHEALPAGLPDADYKDMEAYRKGTHPFFKVRHLERLVVNEELGVAGTPDRVSQWIGDGDLIAPDGTVILPEELLITDLKTGRVDFGALKMAMQLAIYSRSELNVPGSHEREWMGPVSERWGIIMHLPAGSGELTLYWADLELGWKAVQVARDVREMRSMSKQALLPFLETNK